MLSKREKGTVAYLLLRAIGVIVSLAMVAGIIAGMFSRPVLAETTDTVVYSAVDGTSATITDKDENTQTVYGIGSGTIVSSDKAVGGEYADVRVKSVATDDAEHLGDETTRGLIAGILYYGYPKNATDLKATYADTQKAIDLAFDFAGKALPESDAISDGAAALYKAALAEPVKGATLYRYAPVAENDNEKYPLKSMVGATFADATKKFATAAVVSTEDVVTKTAANAVTTDEATTGDTTTGESGTGDTTTGESTTGDSTTGDTTSDSSSTSTDPASEEGTPEETTPINISRVSKSWKTGEYKTEVNIKITEEDGTSVDEWVTAEEAYTAMLVPGKTYLIADTDGGEYTLSIAADGTPSIDGDNNGIDDQGNVVIGDPVYTVMITKTDEDGKALEGARLKLVDSDKKAVDTWTSASDAQTFQLWADTYTLTETKAPTDYQRITTKIKFTVDEAGKVTLDTKKVNGSGKISVEKGDGSEVDNHIKLQNAKKTSTTTRTTRTATTKKDDSTKAGNAKTGDDNPVAFLAMMLVVAVMTIVVFSRGRAQH